MDDRVGESGVLIRQWDQYKIPIVLGLGSIILILVALFLLIKSTQTSSQIQFTSEATVAGTMSTSIHIDIEGAVKNPGVYVLPSGSRVEDAVVAAGGFSIDANEEKIASTINRAAKLVDGGKLYIPKEGDDASILTSHIVDATNTSDSSSTNSININTSSQSQLESLPGIGPVTAAKIISGRPYQTLEELVTKKAVGQATFEKIRDQIAI